MDVHKARVHAMWEINVLPPNAEKCMWPSAYEIRIFSSYLPSCSLHPSQTVDNYSNATDTRRYDSTRESY